MEVNKQNNKLYLSSCIIDQKLRIELLNQYWPHLQDLNSSGKLGFIAF